MAILNDWHVCKEPIGEGLFRFRTPVGKDLQLVGHISDTRRLYAGKVIRTAPVIEIDGGIIKTKFGQDFELGEMKNSYRCWLNDILFHYDPKNPILLTE